MPSEVHQHLVSAARCSVLTHLDPQDAPRAIRRRLDPSTVHWHSFEFANCRLHTGVRESARESAETRILRMVARIRARSVTDSTPRLHTPRRYTMKIPT